MKFVIFGHFLQGKSFKLHQIMYPRLYSMWLDENFTQKWYLESDAPIFVVTKRETVFDEGCDFEEKSGKQINFAKIAEPKNNECFQLC